MARRPGNDHTKDGMMTRSPEYDALLSLSARIGADPALVQGAGGNTSIKEDGTLWIKASGLWLRDALARDLMVPVALEPLLDALRCGDPSTERPQTYVIEDRNPGGLRPSIETTMHALLSPKVVVHVHCVDTIAHAVQVDGETLVAERLAGLPYAFVPYARPGLPLTQAIMRRIDVDTRILVLGNHGLTVAGETVADAEALLGEVRRRLTLTARAVVAPDIGSLERLAVGSAYRPPSDPAAHGVATDPVSCRHAGGGSLYPDHVIFLGEGSVIAQPGESGLDVERRFGATGLPLPPTILFPGKGVLVSTAISEGALAMAGCLSHVTSRLPETARLRYFSDLENAELLGWDAEKYRQALNASLDGGRR